jgi:hypothetical protein
VSGTDAYAQHPHQFSIFQTAIGYTVEVPTNHAEHTRKELVRMLSIRVRRKNKSFILSSLGYKKLNKHYYFYYFFNWCAC